MQKHAMALSSSGQSEQNGSAEQRGVIGSQHWHRFQAVWVSVHSSYSNTTHAASRPCSGQSLKTNNEIAHGRVMLLSAVRHRCHLQFNANEES